MENIITTPTGKASYLYVLNPIQNQKGQLKYSTDILWPKNTDLSSFKKSLEEVAKNYWGAKIPKTIFDCIKDGDGVRPKSKEPYSPEYKGHYFVTLRNSLKPGVVDQLMQPITSETEIYSGCYIRASVFLKPYDFDGNRGIALYLQNVQKVKDGDRFGGTVGDPEAVFDVIDTEQDNPKNYADSDAKVSLLD
jgi:hypothetical protein